MNARTVDHVSLHQINIPVSALPASLEIHVTPVRYRHDGNNYAHKCKTPQHLFVILELQFFEGHYYLPHDSHMINYPSAVAQCTHTGGHLVEFNSDLEAQFFYDFLYTTG